MASSTCQPDELSRILGHWYSGRATLAEDLAIALIALVDDGLLPAGIGLPAQRTLAAALGVSRGVVTNAYAVLEGRGYLVSVQGSGSRVSSARGTTHLRTGGRLFSFTDVPTEVVDLSTGALPASDVATKVIGAGLGALAVPFLTTDGYFPAGLPILRQAIAEQLTRDGIPTKAENILVTAGAQQATWLVVTTLVHSGDLVLVEEPTFRGALEAIRSQGAIVQGIPRTRAGLDPDLVRQAQRRRPVLLYCQTAIHNPTGQTTTASIRRELAATLNRTRIVTIDDRSMGDLVLTGPAVVPSLDSLVEPELHIMLGSLSKLFWGGLRLGWIRATPERIKKFTEIRKIVSLGCPVIDQLIAVDLLQHTVAARRERRTMLTQSLADTEAELNASLPHWTWDPIAGGSGLWVDTHTDAVALAERAKRVGVRLVPGPSFSAHGGQGSMLRLPVWHEAQQLRHALSLLAPLAAVAEA